MPNKRAVVMPNKCADCHPCPAAEGCSIGAIKREEEDDVPFVDIQCRGCGTCQKDCPREAIMLL